MEKARLRTLVQFCQGNEKFPRIFKEEIKIKKYKKFKNKMSKNKK